LQDKDDLKKEKERLLQEKEELKLEKKNNGLFFFFLYL
jgi:hypothetical protein